MADTITDSASAPAPASTADDGFTYESASVPFTPAPADTTDGKAQATAGGSVDDDAAVAAAEADLAAAPPADPDADHAGEQPVAAKVASAKKKGPSLAERQAKLKKDLDRATYELRETQRQITEARGQLTRTVRGQTPPAVPATPAAAATRTPAATDATPMPTLPKYRDFDTDEAYEAAVAEYHTQLGAWQTAREDRLAARITSGVDERLTAQQRRERAAVADTELVGRLDAARAKHPDWKEKSESLGTLQSAWYDPAKHTSQTPFLTDMALNHADGPELLYWLGANVDAAQAVADLVPTRPLRDALVHAPSMLPFFQHFATDEGRQEFEELKRMHPVRAFQAIGALGVRLATAPGGSVPAARHAITAATPSARPPVGSPGARGAAAVDPRTMSFEDWNAAEDARERAERMQRAGISASA